MRHTTCLLSIALRRSFWFLVDRFLYCGLSDRLTGFATKWLFSKWFISCLKHYSFDCLAKKFQIGDGLHILSMTSCLPLLRIGLISPVFSFSGNTPVSNDTLVMCWMSGCNFFDILFEDASWDGIKFTGFVCRFPNEVLYFSETDTIEMF